MKAIVFLFLCAFCLSVEAQTTVNRDPEIEQMVKEVNSDSLQSYIKSLVAFGTRHTLSTQKSKTRGLGAARLWVQKRMNEFAAASGGRMSVVLDTTMYQPDGKRIDSAINLGNVVATLRGTDPNDKRIFLISGHMDSRRSNEMDREHDSPGANDDGSGSVTVMECARIMSKHSFPATVVFIVVSGEEQGLLGANYNATKARKNDVQIEAVLNNDIMGSNNSSETNIINNTQVRVFSEGLPFYDLSKNASMIRQLGLENDGKARQLARYVKEVGERYVDNLQVVMIYRNDRFLRGGDHTPYVENGYAAVRLTEMNENYYHQHQDIRKEGGIQYGDLAEFMDFEYLRKNAAMNLACLANLAKAPKVPDAAGVEVKKLSNYTHLSWKKPSSDNVAGYYILMRETTSPVWQKKIFTKDTDYVLPYSKDNYFFGVQSVSGTGNESLAVVPMPIR